MTKAKATEKSISKVGDVNSNGQRLMAKTSRPGTGYRQYIWLLECTRLGSDGSECGHSYGANEGDFPHKRCPSCQQRPPSPVIEEVPHA
jgi:hypothetical protein